MKIKVENILLELLTEEELIALNDRVVDQLKHLRRVRALHTSRKLTVGCDVSFNDNNGKYVTGTVLKINRVRCKIKIERIAGPQTWNVPISMLKVIA